jgi:hypothetical protein
LPAAGVESIAWGAEEMSIAISIKINDGLVLAADSASTVMGQTPQGLIGVANTYNNANKIFNLVKGLPIGLVTWGTGSIGAASIATMVKDLREMLSTKHPAPEKQKWHIDPHDYKMNSVAEKVKKFIYDDNYVPTFAAWPQKPDLGCIVGGYSSGCPMPDEYMIEIQGGQCGPPKLVRQNEETGITWGGMGEAINRLLLGWGTALPSVLQQVGLSPQVAQGAMNGIRASLMVPLAGPAMPVQDAIELAEFLVDTTIKFIRFAPGAPTVGGPIEIAAITKHEGFRWVRRKYYFTRELNPEETCIETEPEV